MVKSCTECWAVPLRGRWEESRAKLPMGLKGLKGPKRPRGAEGPRVEGPSGEPRARLGLRPKPQVGPRLVAARELGAAPPRAARAALREQPW